MEQQQISAKKLKASLMAFAVRLIFYLNSPITDP